jgi:ribose transport system permease protein
MTVADASAPVRRPAFRRMARHQGALVALAVLVALIGFNALISGRLLSYFEVSFLSSGGATLALAAIGQTVVVLTGGFDLSAGAVVSLVNVVLSSRMGMADPPQVIAMWALAGIGIGVVSGAVNGFFVAVLRLQPIVVTLSTMFILQGITLLVMDKPGGMIAPGLSTALTGDAIPGLLPMPVVLIAAVLVLWVWFKATPVGRDLYAIGSDREAAAAQGVDTRRAEFLVYVIAGACYGLAGVFVSAQQGAGDPLVGNPLLLQVFAAIVIGGTILGGGRGGPVGSVLGAYTLVLVVNILLVLNISAYYQTIVEAAILVLAVLAASLRRESILARQIRAGLTRVRAARAGVLPGQALAGQGEAPAPSVIGPPRAPVEVLPWFERHREALRYAVPSYAVFLLVLVATGLVFGQSVVSWGYWNSLLVISVFLLILALGQGSVILTGGLDLSVPWTIAFCGIVFAGLVQGSDAAMIWALPLALGLGLAIGLVNGLAVTVLGLSPIVATLAMNGVLQGAALLFSNGTPDGFSSPWLRWFMTDRTGLVTPVAVFAAAFVALAAVLMSRTPFARRVYAIGNSPRAAELSGIRVSRTLVQVYMLSGLCAALVGCLLTGFSGQASLGMGDEYLLPSIAVVVVGGALITGGRGSYLGMVGGVLLLTALQTLLAGTTLPTATRAIIYGLIVLGAVLTLRERRP